MDFEGFYLSIDYAEGPSALDARERNLWTSFVAETAEPLHEPDGPSPACRNLLRAGFRQASVRQTLRPRRG